MRFESHTDARRYTTPPSVSTPGVEVRAHDQPVSAPGVAYRTFATVDGCEECYFVIQSSPDRTFEEALAELQTRYCATTERHALSSETVVFTRFYLSDITNQKDALRSSRLLAMVSSGAVSTIEQRPLRGGHIAMLCYHLRPRRGAVRKSVVSDPGDPWRGCCTAHLQHYSLQWNANFAQSDVLDSGAQTQSLLHDFDASLKQGGLSLRRNTVRTWIYVRDIDNHYMGMVNARREYFRHQGLTRDTRYIASTGIQGNALEHSALVSMDALSIGGISEEQIVRMEALDTMPPTIKYGVTFERGLRIRFGDRSHLFVSGTASIDAEGEIMHKGDPCRQASRAIENVRALLAEQGAMLSDMCYIILYLRNPSDSRAVLEVAAEELPPGVPLLTVNGAVCRPGWLVELEGVAAIEDQTDFAPFA